MASQDVDPLAGLAWEAALPVHCELSEQCRDPANKSECYFMVPRQGYLGLSLKVVLRTFTHVSSNEKSYIWFSVNITGKELILPWHWPMGTIVDMLAVAFGKTSVGGLFDSPTKNALHITVHFDTNPPQSETVLPLLVGGVDRQTEAIIKQHHKFYLAARYLSPKAWYSMETQTLSSFYLSVRSNDPRAFFQGRAALENQVKRDLPELFEAGEHVAVVIFHIDGATTTYRADLQQCSTFGMLLREVLFCCYDVTDEEVQGMEPLDPRIADVFILGTRPPLCVPTAFLRDHLCCADLMIHIVVRCKTSNTPRDRPIRKAQVTDASPNSVANDSVKFDTAMQMSDSLVASPTQPTNASEATPLLAKPADSAPIASNDI